MVSASFVTYFLKSKLIVVISVVSNKKTFVNTKKIVNIFYLKLIILRFNYVNM